MQATQPPSAAHAAATTGEEDSRQVAPARRLASADENVLVQLRPATRGAPRVRSAPGPRSAGRKSSSVAHAARGQPRRTYDMPRHHDPDHIPGRHVRGTRQARLGDEAAQVGLLLGPTAATLGETRRMRRQLAACLLQRTFEPSQDRDVTVKAEGSHRGQNHRIVQTLPLGLRHLQGWAPVAT